MNVKVMGNKSQGRSNQLELLVLGEKIIESK